MPRRSRKKIGGRPYRPYTDELLSKVLQEIDSKKISQREAQKRYGINRNSLALRLKARSGSPTTSSRKPGRQTILSREEEEMISAHVITQASYGFPIGKLELRLIVKSYLNRCGRTVLAFKNNVPGEEWAKSFLGRHRELSMRMSQSISRHRAGVNSAIVGKFFDSLEVELAGIPPEKIWNYDESNLTDDPGAKKVLVRRGCKHPEIIKNATKASTSIMMCGNAAGELAPVYVTYKAENVYPEWMEGGPPKARYNRSKSGWFDMKIFEDWFEFTLLPLLRRQTGTKVIIGDNLSSHISVHVIGLCEQNNIKFIALPPNSTHLLQPLDVGFFGPLKKAWRIVLNEWKVTPQGRHAGCLPKAQFPKLLTKLLDQMGSKIEADLRGGFRGAGIYPLKRDNVLKRLCDHVVQEDRGQIRERVSDTFIEELRRSRQEITDRPTRGRKKKINVAPGKGITLEDLRQEEVLHPGPSFTSQKRPAKTCKRKRKKQIENDISTEGSSDDDIPYDESEDSMGSVMMTLERNSADEDDPAPISELIARNEHPSVSHVDEVMDDSSSEEHDNDFVVVKYNGHLYPGRRLSKPDTDGEAPVSAMVKKGKFWVWPPTPDVVWYKEGQIVREINPPKEMKGGMFLVDMKP